MSVQECEQSITIAIYGKLPQPPCRNVFQLTGTIFKLVQDIIGTLVFTKFYADWTINVAPGSFPHSPAELRQRPSLTLVVAGNAPAEPLASLLMYHSYTETLPAFIGALPYSARVCMGPGGATVPSRLFPVLRRSFPVHPSSIKHFNTFPFIPTPDKHQEVSYLLQAFIDTRQTSRSTPDKHQEVSYLLQAFIDTRQTSRSVLSSPSLYRHQTNIKKCPIFSKPL
ncbi:hypothetical protein DPMN_004036 [Dreissena polymorpha]|uniref:Uncharacterized protein n=1 Tax=Dreissena polymorpha TaxID=45954 RepID=A0A9D4RVB6_DREPO|nr:hypothetical protein DPMN_004036 [Dreissena polymorpha]